MLAYLGVGRAKLYIYSPPLPKLYYCIITNLFYKNIFFAFDDENIIIIDHDKTNILRNNLILCFEIFTQHFKPILYP